MVETGEIEHRLDILGHLAKPVLAFTQFCRGLAVQLDFGLQGRIHAAQFGRALQHALFQLFVRRAQRLFRAAALADVPKQQPQPHRNSALAQDKGSLDFGVKRRAILLSHFEIEQFLTAGARVATVRVPTPASIGSDQRRGAFEFARCKNILRPDFRHRLRFVIAEENVSHAVGIGEFLRGQIDFHQGIRQEMDELVQFLRVEAQGGGHGEIVVLRIRNHSGDHIPDYVGAAIRTSLAWINRLWQDYLHPAGLA